MKKGITTIVLLTILVATVTTAGVLTSDTKDRTLDRPMVRSDSKGLLDCSGMISANLGFSYTMSNGVGTSNVSSWGDCWTYDMSGPEVVFHLSLPTPVLWQVTLTQDVADVDLLILEGTCDEAFCVYATDSGGVYTTAPLSGEFYFVVDGYNGAVGSFTIDFEAMVPPPSACDDYAQAFPGEDGDLVPGGDYPISGETCYSTDHINTLACGAYSEAGLDDFYQMTLAPGAAVTCTITNIADGALWILDACDMFEDANCLAYADATFTGEPEVVNYQNNTGAVKNVWLVVDSYGSGSCGTYTGVIQLNGEAVPNRTVSWGALKTLYQ